MACARGGVVGGFLGLTFWVLVSVRRICTSVEGDGDGYDGQADCGSPEIVEGFLCRFRLGLGFPDLVVDG